MPRIRAACVAGCSLAALIAGLTAGCESSAGPAPAPRSWRMGFSPIPPRQDPTVVFQSLEMWTRRADAAILHIPPPWAALLADTAPVVLLQRDAVPLVNYFRGKGLSVVITVDVTDGLDRSKEAPELIALGRSITDTAVQRRYVQYVGALDSLLHPDYLGLAAETNLIRAAAPDSVYQAVVQMANAAAAKVNGQDPSQRLYVSVQVEVAWGRLTMPAVYTGIAQDLTDFPFVEAVGLSSYPYLAGFSVPESLPLDYYSRLVLGHPLPELVVEGGWTSASVGPVVSSPAIEARYLDRQAQLLDSAHAIAVFQLTFADLDLSSLSLPPGSILPLF